MLSKKIREINSYSALLKSEAIFIGFTKARKYFFILNFLLDA